jgi:excisionase family DNA binding protein
VSDPNPNELLTVPEIAKELKYTEATVRTWIKQGKLRAIRATGREYRVRRSDLDAMITTIEPHERAQLPVSPLGSTSDLARWQLPDDA